MPFCVSWMGADLVVGAAASNQEQEQQLHPWRIQRVDCSAVAVLKGSVSSGWFDLTHLFGCRASIFP